MIRKYLILTLNIFVLASCDSLTKDFSEPDYNPHLLKPGKNYPAKMIPIDMDSVERPVRQEAEALIEKQRRPEIHPEFSNFEPAEWPEYKTARLKKVDRSVFAKPKYFPSKGKKVLSAWPQWVPTNTGYAKDVLFPFSYLDVEQGLNSSMILSLLEDRQGNIWLGTGDGVSVWDGNGFMHMTQAQGLNGGEVRGLLEDRHGKIWAGTMAGLCFWDGEGFTHFTEEEGLLDGNVWNNLILEDRNGNIWIATWDGGVSVWDGSGFYHYTEDQGLNNNKVRAMMEDKRGRIWMGFEYGGLMILDPVRGQSWTMTTEEGLASDDIQCLMQDRLDRVWIGTRGDGLNVWEENDGASIAHFTNSQGLGSNNITRLLEDRNGNIWIGSNNGVSMWDQGQHGKESGFFHFSEAQGFGNDRVEALLEDRQGRIWAAYFGSGVKIWHPPNEGVMPHSKVTEPFVSNYQKSLYEDRQGNIWMSSEGSGLRVWSPANGGSVAHYTEAGGLSANNVRHISEDRNNNMWIITRSGLEIWDSAENQRVTHYPSHWNFGGTESNFILEGQSGDMWIGHNDRGMTRMNGNILTHFNTAQGMAHRGVDDIVQDQYGKIWGGGWAFNNEISIWDGKGFYHFWIDLERPRHSITGLMKDRESNIWMSTKGSGIAIWDGKEYTQFTTAEGLSSNVISSLWEDRYGDIWLGTAQGINRLRRTEIPDQWQVQTIDHQDGLIEVHVKNLLVDQRDQLWILGSKGIERMSLQLLEPDSSRPSITIRDLQPFLEFVDWRQTKNAVEQGGHPLTAGQGIHLGSVAFDSVISNTNLPYAPVFPYDINQLTFSWSSIHWSAPQKLQYSFLLAGKDGAWSPLVTDNKVTYTDLRPGVYSFKVRAVGNNGLWSETATYDFRVLPPWWLTWWAYASYSMAALGILYMIRHLELQKQKRKLEEQKRINNVTAKFVPNAFIHTLGKKDIMEVQLGDAVAQETTVMFSDIRDYTSLSEDMTPEENFRFVNAFNRRMGPVIQQHGGFVNQYLGDAIMALFNDAPIDGLDAAIDMQKTLARYNLERLADQLSPIRVGIGLHTGPLIMGIIGDDQRMDAATISDTVNTASRIESLTKYFKVNILLSAESLNGVSPNFQTRFLGHVLLKGKKAPTAIYECFEGDHPEQLEKKTESQALFAEGMDQYLTKQFAAAVHSFEKVVASNPEDQTAQLFLYKANGFIAKGVPENWTGVEVMSFK